jgi:hypothetical protein
VAQIENDSQSLALGIGMDDGSNIWSMARPKGANWTSPIPFEHSAKPSVALQSGKGIHLVDVRTWSRSLRIPWWCCHYILKCARWFDVIGTFSRDQCT